MRVLRLFPVLLVVTIFGAESELRAQSCTGLCQQQVSCPNNGTTSISGVVYAPNGIDPLPNATVYIPNAPVDPFTAGVSCPVVGAAPPGSPLVGATTAVDGTFTLTNVPVGSNIPLVAVTGRWRRQVVVPSTAACTNTTFSTRMPQTQAEGDIPKIAVATGAVDQVECVLRKVGIADSEFTDASGTGRVNLFASNVSGAGSVVDASTSSQSALMSNAALLNSYDVLMLPCEGSPFTKPAVELANLISFANAGGRVYSSHYSYTWMYQNPPFNSVVNWTGTSQNLADGTATVDTSFSEGQTLSKWLQLVGASTTPGQMAISTLRKDFTSVNPPTQSWLELNDSADGNPVMQFVFDTPIASTTNQCGRVLFNEYHVENGSSSPAKPFPSECSGGAMTPQEKLLEYSLFELTSEGGQPTLAPTSADFGAVVYGFTSAPQAFTWTNNSSFPSGISSLTATGDFAQTNNCTTVAPGASCTINVTFTPTALGSRSGTLTIVSSGNTLSASLMGSGVPGFSLSAGSLSFGNLDVGASVSQALTLTNTAATPLPVPPFIINGAYAVSTAACGTSVAGHGTCTVTVTFNPTATGPLAGTLTVNSGSLLYSGLSATLTGTGVDFSLLLSPSSGTVVSGDGTSITATLTPIAGFSAPVTISCSVAVAATAASCNLGNPSLTLSAVTSSTITLSTTSKYTVVGYGGLGGRWLWVFGAVTGTLLWVKRRRLGAAPGLLLLIVSLAALSASVTGCSGKLPDLNPAYTSPGTYAVTVSATDGFLVRKGTYTLTVH